MLVAIFCFRNNSFKSQSNKEKQWKMKRLLENPNRGGKGTVNVLIVDDDEHITRTFSRILTRKGYKTDIAQTGAEAIKKATAQHFNVALVDICLPDINGMELLPQLGDHDGKMIKIVITGFPTMAKDNVHPDAYLLKPVKPQELLSLIDQKTSQT